MARRRHTNKYMKTKPPETFTSTLRQMNTFCSQIQRTWPTRYSNPTHWNQEPCRMPPVPSFCTRYYQNDYRKQQFHLVGSGRPQIELRNYYPSHGYDRHIETSRVACPMNEAGVAGSDYFCKENPNLIRRNVEPKRPKFGICSFQGHSVPSETYNPYLDLNDERRDVASMNFTEMNPEPYIPQIVKPSSIGAWYIDSSADTVKQHTNPYFERDSPERVPRTSIDDSLKASMQRELRDEYLPTPPVYTRSSYKDFLKVCRSATKLPEVIHQKPLVNKTPRKKRKSRGLFSQGGRLQHGRPLKSCDKLSKESSPDVEVVSSTVVIDLLEKKKQMLAELDALDKKPTMDDEIILLDLEEGEIRSDIDCTPIHTPRKSRSFGSRNHSNRTDVTEITLDDISADDDDDCKVIAVVNSHTKPIRQKSFKFSKTPIKRRGKSRRSGGGATNCIQELRRRSFNRLQSSTQLIAKRLTTIAKFETTPVSTVTARRSIRKSLKRLQKPPFHKNSVQKSNRNCNKYMGAYDWIEHDTRLSMQYWKNEARTGRRRNRPFVSSTNSHDAVARFPIGVDLNNGNHDLPLPTNSVSRMPLGKPRQMIIDGSNIAIGHGNGKVFSCLGLRICVNQIKKKLRHSKIVCFVPRFRAKKSESLDSEILDELEKEGILKYTPSREVNGRHITSYDDRFILDYATETKGIVITNDNYKDLYESDSKWRDTISNRLLQFTWVDDILMFPSDPLGKYGPTLEEFCSFGTPEEAVTVEPEN